MHYLPLSLTDGIAAIARCNSDLGQVLQGLVDDGLVVRGPAFYRRTYAYGDALLREGEWQAGALPPGLDYAYVPLAVALDRVVEVTYHAESNLGSLPVARALLQPGELWGGFELLDSVGSGLEVHRIESPRPKAEAWNLTAGSTAFRFFSNRRDYRKQLAALLPSFSRVGSARREFWTLDLLKEKALKDSKQSQAVRLLECPEYHYLRALEDKHHRGQPWSLDVLYFTQPVVDFILRLDSVAKYLVFHTVFASAWRQSRERRTYGDVASFYNPRLSKVLHKSGTRYFDKLGPLLFDFLLTCHCAQMGFRPILPDEDLKPFTNRGPFAFYHHRELSEIERPIILLPEFVGPDHPTVFPLSQPTPNGRLEPNSWEKDVYEPVAEAIETLYEAGALPAEQIEVGFHYRPKSKSVVSRYWPNSEKEAPVWIREMKFDPESRCFLTAQRMPRAAK